MKQRDLLLDALRVGAALLVLAGHVRAFVFKDWSLIAHHGTWEAAFYFATGLGHQGVVVFFVLSGYLVGGSVATSWRQGTWSMEDYILRRLVRLQVVLLPALLMTWMWDTSGASLTAGAGYDGRYVDLIHSGPERIPPIDHSLSTLLGNAAFLMSIQVPVFGSNGPLWSLAYEFWYYVMFPCAWLALHCSGVVRAISVAVVAILVFWLPAAAILGGVVWICGFCAWYARAEIHCVQSRTGRGTGAILGGAVFLGSMVAVRLCEGPWADLSLGLATAALIVLAGTMSAGPSSAAARAVARLADGSYTLYACHFPVLCALAYRLILPERFEPDSAKGIASFLAMSAATLVYAVGMWWLFERNTDSWRRALARLLLRYRREVRPLP